MLLEKIFNNQKPKEKKLFLILMVIRLIIFTFSLYYTYTQPLLDALICVFILFFINKINDIIFLGLLNQLREKAAIELAIKEKKKKDKKLKENQKLSSAKYFGDENFSKKN